MYTIKVEHSFDSAHFLADYAGKCANIHGHRWRVEFEVEAQALIEEGQFRGMVADFSDLKRDVKQLIDFYDHALIIEEGTMRQETLKCLTEDNFRVIQVSFRPTAENFSYFFYSCVKEKGYNVKRVTVFETPANSAAYQGCEVRS